MLAKKKNSIRLETRDYDLLRGLFESRIMTARHIAILYFHGKKEAAKKRLQKIKAAGLIGARKRKVSDPSALFLTRKAFTLLRENGILAEYPSFSLPALEKRARVSELTIRHELEIMDAKAAFHAAMRGNNNFTIAEFSTWPLLYQFEASRNGHIADILVKPDGYIRIHEKEKDGGISVHSFFLEVDRSSETQDTLIARAGLYLDHYRSGGFAIRNGASRSAFEDFPFRVLMVFKTIERRNNIAARLLQNNPPILTFVWLTTLEEVRTNPLGEIWIRPLEYRETVKGTPFEAGARRVQWEYRRQTEREIFIESKVKKSSLLGSQ